MSKRIVFRTPTAKVYWDSEWREYVVKTPDGSYHTTEKDDAIATAEDMDRRYDPKAGPLMPSGRLGDPTEVHTRHGRDAAERFTMYARSIHDFLMDGRCEEAVRGLTRAAAAIGHLVAHSGAGGQGLVTNIYAANYDNLRDDVIGACVIKRRKRRTR